MSSEASDILKDYYFSVGRSVLRNDNPHKSLEYFDEAYLMYKKLGKQKEQIFYDTLAAIGEKNPIYAPVLERYYPAQVEFEEKEKHPERIWIIYEKIGDILTNKHKNKLKAVKLYRNMLEKAEARQNETQKNKAYQALNTLFKTKHAENDHKNITAYVEKWVSQLNEKEEHDKLKWLHEQMVILRNQ